MAESTNKNKQHAASRDATSAELAFAGLSIVSLLVLFPLSEWVHVHLPIEAYRFVCGFILSTYGVIGYALAIHLYKAKRAGNLAHTIDSNVWTRPFSAFLIVFLLAIGLLAWYISWEGKGTGLYYGVGAFIGGALAESGIGSILKRGV